MTRQEAIEDLKVLRFNHNVMINGTNHTSKALDIAIEALELIETKQQAIKASNMIDRQAAITIPVMPIEHRKYQTFNLDDAYEQGWIDCQDCIKELPSAEPEIIRCRDCRKHNQGINEAPYLTDRCPLILHRGYAHGHEFDYQYCTYAERKEN